MSMPMVKRYFGSNESMWRRFWWDGDGHSYTLPLFHPRTIDAPVLKSFTRKWVGKNSIETWLCLQNWETDKTFLWMDGAHKTSFNVKLWVGVAKVVEPIWAMGIPLPSLMVMSSLPPYSEWIIRLCRFEVMWWETLEFTTQLLLRF